MSTCQSSTSNILNDEYIFVLFLSCLSVSENGMLDKKNRKNSGVSKKVKDASDERTSKYFRDSKVKTEEPEDMSDHSEEMSPMFKEHSSPSKQVKEEEEESEDEEDWEEVEGT